MSGAPIPIHADGDLIALCRVLLADRAEIIPIRGGLEYATARTAARRYLRKADNFTEAARLVPAALKENEKR